MKKVLVIIFLTGILISSCIYYWQTQQVAYIKDKEISSEEFYSLLSQRSFYVYFYSPTCGDCRKAEPKITEAVKELDINFVKLNIDQYPEIFEEYELPGIPAILLIEKGEVINGIVGVLEDTQGYIDFFTDSGDNGDI
jgi:thiol-disulfide isomerase/thioredoxin